MNRADRYIFNLWIALTIAAAIVIFASWVLLVLILSIIAIPIALLLQFAPTLWLYLTPGLILYAVARYATRKVGPAWIALIATVLLTCGVGVIIPTLANRETDRRVTALLEQDAGTPLALPTGISVTRFFDRGYISAREECDTFCQRLLLTRTVDSYVEAPRDQFRRIARMTRPVLQFSLGPPDGTCRNSLLWEVPAAEEEVGRGFPKPLLSEKLDELGLCLHAVRTRDARSDFIMVETRNTDPKAGVFRFGGQPRSGPLLQLELHPIAPFSRWETYRRKHERFLPIMRRTYVEYARLSVPLRVDPPFSFTEYTPGHWTRSGIQSLGKDFKFSNYNRWEPWITNDIGVRGLRRR